MEHYYQNIGEDWFNYPVLYSEMVKKFENGSKFVEVGSWKGRSTCFLGVEITNSGKSISLDAVDTWLGSEEHYGFDVLNEDGLYKEFINNIEPLKNIINPVRMKSLQASELYEDDSLEFVFIDASHKYEDVIADLNAWYPKVKKGGVFAGHDYTSYWEGVTRAVNDFFHSKNLNFDSSETCFIHMKP